MDGRILVTGAFGQIGSELVPILRSTNGKGNVVAMGHGRRPSDEVLGDGPVEYGDVGEMTQLEAIIKKYDISQVYHLAALLSAVGEKNPQLAWDLNMRGLLNVLELARKYELRIFWPSSIGVFGTGYPREKTPQETVMLPTTMYGVTKVAGELLCNYYHSKFGVDCRSVRFPGIISSITPPGGGTTDYAVAIFYEAIKHHRYECFVRADTVLPMMYMPDALDAAIRIMSVPKDLVRRHDGYNLNAMSFSARQLTMEIKKHIPALQVTYNPDFRQAIADTWPTSLEDSQARSDWGYDPKWGFSRMVEDMLDVLTKRHEEGRL
ncbi:MAG TPA: NAD-dependent epimerase/dehydratase family protein [Methanomassiliicoccales archaeon]|nr:NAD-dependent epimerase/dehydratase family protein [Methanomassiliicoccales archaeon]